MAAHANIFAQIMDNGSATQKQAFTLAHTVMLRQLVKHQKRKTFHLGNVFFIV